MLLDTKRRLSSPEKQIERTRAMGAYKASTLVDWEQGRALGSWKPFSSNPSVKLKKPAPKVPRLESLCRVLQQINSL